MTPRKYNFAKFFFPVVPISVHCSHCFILVELVVKNPPANTGDIRDLSLIPGSERSPEGGHVNLLCSYLDNPMDRGVWLATVCRVTKSQTQLKQLSIAYKWCNILCAFFNLLIHFEFAYYKLCGNVCQNFQYSIFILPSVFMSLYELIVSSHLTFCNS